MHDRNNVKTKLIDLFQKKDARKASQAQKREIAKI